MGTSVLHIKTEVECRVYLFDEEKGIAKPGTWFNLEVRKGEQDFLFVSTEDDAVLCFKSNNVEESDRDYKMSLEQSEFFNVNTPATNEEIANGVEDEYGVVYSPDGTELLMCSYDNLETYNVEVGCKVIRGSAFRGVGITNITLPSGLTHIGGMAFCGCENLTAITLSASLKHIGEWAFGSCWGLTAITLPASLTQIGDGTFSRSSIRSVVNHSPHFSFQDGCLIDVQGKRLIAFLSDKEKVILPAGLTHIGDYAFQVCWNLTAITLPASLTHIGDSAFSMSSIRSVINHSPHFSFQDGCLIDVQGKRLIAFLSDKEKVFLPAGLTHIGDSAFYECKNLTDITLPDGLTHIGDRAFYECKNLTAITLPDSLTHIGDSAFCGCENLTAITLPASLKHIGEWAFGSCWGLTAITLPASLTHIGDSAFEGCDNLTDITLPASLTHVGDSAFEGCWRLTFITLPASLTHIGNRAFRNCFGLTAITLPSSLTHIGDSAFEGCEKLTAITLPAGLTHIGDSAFLGYMNFTVIHIPQGMRKHFEALLPSYLHLRLREPKLDESLPF